MVGALLWYDIVRRPPLLSSSATGHGATEAKTLLVVFGGGSAGIVEVSRHLRENGVV